MRIRGLFVLNRWGVRDQILLDNLDAVVTDRLVTLANGVKPSGTEVFIGESRGRAGRKVIWIMDRNPMNATSPQGRQAERRWRKSQLLQALNRIGGMFLRTRGREF